MGVSGYELAGQRRTTMASGAQAKDVLWLLILGMTARQATSLRDIFCAVDLLAPDFTPTNAVVCDCVEEALARGSIAACAGDRDAWSITDSGREDLSLLLCHPGYGVTGPLGRVTARLQVGLLDLLPEDQRPGVVDRLVADARRDREATARVLTAPWAGPYGDVWKACEQAAARDFDIARALAAWQGGQA